MRTKKYSRGMVLGVFDGLHTGHRYFLTCAAEQCDELVVVVTLDDAVLHFKNRLPKFILADRVEKVKKFGAGLNKKITVVPGDGVVDMGQWLVLKKYQPEVVFLGYDQAVIGEEMAKLGVPKISTPAHYPKQYKSSIING